MKKPRRPDLQEKILAFFIEYQTEHAGLPPTRREIADKVKASTSLVNMHIKKLAESGIIKYVGYADARNIQLTGGRWYYETLDN